MEYLSIAEGIVAFRCWYITDYESSRSYDSVVIVTQSRYIVISVDDANRLLSQIQRVENNYGEPSVIGVNNYLEFSTSGNWNQHVYIDRDSVKLSSNDRPIDLRKFSTILHKVLCSQTVIKGYRDKSNNIEMRFWATDCQFYLQNNRELYFVPNEGNPNWFNSNVMDKLVDYNTRTREALRIGRIVSGYADLY